MIKNTAGELIGKELIAYDKPVKWWDEEVKELTRVAREANTRYRSSKNTVRWEGYTRARKDVQKVGEKKEKGACRRLSEQHKSRFLWLDKKLWAWMVGIMGNMGEKIDKGTPTLRAKSCEMIRTSKRNKDLLPEHYRELGTPKPSERFDTEFEKESTRVRRQR